MPGLLTGMDAKISAGLLERGEPLGEAVPCWEIEACGKEDCPGYENPSVRCWHLDRTL